MARITLPAGTSLREVAERLGVSLDELKSRAGVSDAEKPLPADMFVDLPDGFLKAADRARRASYAAIPGTPTTRSEGMNALLALDIERKRIERDGAKRKEESNSDEQDGLMEAQGTFARLEAASNELAISLYQRLTDSPRSRTRSIAHAAQGLAHAYAHLLFGAPLAAAQPQALSAAKAALMADPKLPAAHVALAAALRCDATPKNLAEARAALADAAHHGASDVWYQVELSIVARAMGLAHEAKTAVHAALTQDATFALALEQSALHAMHQHDLPRAEDLLRTAATAAPTYLNALARRIGVLRQLGRVEEADDAEAQTLAACERDYHRAKLVTLMADPLQP